MALPNLPPRARLPLLALGFVALAFGTLAGLARAGWPMPSRASSLAGLHGPLLLAAFFGTVIALERAVALARGWAYAAPLLAGAAGLAVVAQEPAVASIAVVAAGLVQVVLSVAIQRRQPALFTATLTAGSACYAIGGLAWAAGAAPWQAAPWWLAFLVLTIAGERLELSRFRPPSAVARRAFVGIAVAILAGLALVALRPGRALLGGALLALSLWLFVNDIARRTVHGKGLTRYIAVSLLAGYAWLAVAGALIAGIDALVPGAPARDAALHALGLGFAFSMVFGHAPIIVPAVLRANVRWTPALYAPLALLHGSLLVRAAGAAAGPAATAAGALGNALALLLFVATLVAAARAGAADR